MNTTQDAQAGSLERSVRRPLCDRIRQHWKPSVGYHELMLAVFPPSEYPNAWTYQVNGGPPGCAMAFGKALRKLGLSRGGEWGKAIHGTPNGELRRGGCVNESQNEK